MFLLLVVSEPVALPGLRLQCCIVEGVRYRARRRWRRIRLRTQTSAPGVQPPSPDGLVSGLFPAWKSLSLLPSAHQDFAFSGPPPHQGFAYGMRQIEPPSPFAARGRARGRQSPLSPPSFKAVFFCLGGRLQARNRTSLCVCARLTLVRNSSRKSRPFSKQLTTSSSSISTQSRWTRKSRAIWRAASV